MNIEVIAIGNEILKGLVVNTNATEIGQALLKEGYCVSRQTSLPDDPLLLKEGLKEALARSQIVIATGGLGPTCDDLTREVAAEIFDSDLYYDEGLAEELKRRYGSLMISLEHQVTLPKKALVLPNPVGTAVGLVFRNDTSTLMLMPGIPREMRVMLMERLLPYLKEHFPQPQKYISRSVHFFQLSESSVDPLLRELQQGYPGVEFGIYPQHGTISICVSVRNADAAVGEQLLEPIIKAIETRFAKHLFHCPSGKIEEAVYLLFKERKWTLSTAESCTGGSIAARLTKIPGASEYFLGSIVSYSNRLKQEWLGVSPELILAKGAVSEEVVLAMVKGIQEKTQSDYAIAISGIAGPSGGTEEKPVGTIWTAIVGKGMEPHVWRFQARGNRDMIIEWGVSAVLGKLIEYTR